MADFVFNIGKAKWGANGALPQSNDAFTLELYNNTSLEADAALKDRTTESDITSGTTVKCNSTNYAARTDAGSGTTSGSPTVTDTSIVAIDAGKGVTGAGIPAGTYVGTVTVGTSFLLSSSQTAQVNVNATATASVSIVIGGRVPLSGITLTIDNTNDWITADCNDVVVPFLGGGTNNQVGKAVIGYDPDTTVAGVHDANVIPQTGHDFQATPDGSSVTATINNFARAT